MPKSNKNRRGQRFTGTVLGKKANREALMELLNCFYSPDFTAKLLAADGVSTLTIPAAIALGPLGWKAQFDFTGLNGGIGQTVYVKACLQDGTECYVPISVVGTIYRLPADSPAAAPTINSGKVPNGSTELI